MFLGFPCGSAGKESTCNVGYQGSIPGLGRPPGEGKGYPVQYSGLENFMECVVHGGRKESDMTEQLHFHFALLCIGEGHGNPLQYSCLENPRDGGAWWAAVYGVAQGWTLLKRLSSSSIQSMGSQRVGPAAAVVVSAFASA